MMTGPRWVDQNLSKQAEGLLLCISGGHPLARTFHLPPPTTQVPPQQPSPTSTSRSLPPRSNCSNLTRKESELQGTGGRDKKEMKSGRLAHRDTHCTHQFISCSTWGTPDLSHGPSEPSFVELGPPQARWVQRQQQARFHWYQVPSPLPPSHSL